MGLDINLYWYKDLKASQEREAKFRERSDEIYTEIERRKPRKREDRFSKRENDECTKRRVELATALGVQDVEDTKNSIFLGDDLPSNKKKIEFQSVRHPKEDVFKIGYFRSSYNASGINIVVPNAIGSNGLYDIFSHNENDYTFCPDWEASLELARGMWNDYVAHLKKSGPIRVSSINPLSLNNPAAQNEIHSEQTALKVFMEQLERKKKEDKKNKDKPDPFGFSEDFGNLHGDFFLGKESMKVRAILHGKSDSGLCKGVGVYIVYEIAQTKPEDDSYTVALDVVVETCEWVLTQKDPQNYYLHWSG